MSEDKQIAAATDLAREALIRYDFPSTLDLTLLKHRENTVFAFTHHTVDYVMRVHRRGYHSDEELLNELQFVGALERLGVQVPRFVPTPDDEKFVLVGIPSNIHQVDLQTFIPNTGNFGDEHTAFDGTATIAPEEFHHLGELIAGAHNATVESRFTVDESRPRWDVEGLVGDKALWGHPLRAAELHNVEGADARAILEEAIDCIRVILSNYGERPHRFGPIHADLTPENVLRTESGLVLIDFDDFAAGWHLFDLATALYFYTRHPRAKEFHQALFAGYQEHRRLETSDFAAFPALLVARGLTYLGWAADRRGEPTAEFHIKVVLPHLVDLAAALVKSTSASASTSPNTPVAPATQGLS